MYGSLIAASLAAATLAEPAFAATDTFRPEVDVSRANPCHRRRCFGQV